MTTVTNYVIFRATLCIKKQTWHIIIL